MIGRGGKDQGHWNPDQAGELQRMVSERAPLVDPCPPGRSDIAMSPPSLGELNR